MANHRILDCFPYLDIKPFVSFAEKAFDSFLKDKGLRHSTPVEFSFNLFVNQPMHSYVGYFPASLQIKTNVTYASMNSPDIWPVEYTLGSFSHDASNCGVGSVHNIQGLKIKGFGSCVLALFEHILAQNNRRKILCTINARQTEAGAGKWLVKRGFKEIDTFIGGNSKQKCIVFSKDLDESPITEYPIWKEDADAKQAS